MGLPEPKLVETNIGGIPCFTDDALFKAIGVRVAFTERAGGFSVPPFSTLNLSEYVGDVREAVDRNRQRALDGLGGEGCHLLVPKQVHGCAMIPVLSGDEQSIAHARSRIAEGADGLIVDADDVAAMLGFADCIPVILVAPSGAFAVVHAGWRGVMQRIAPQALSMLCDLGSLNDPSEANIYIGAHIHKECFETSHDIHKSFIDAFGEGVAYGPDHIDLNRALRKSLAEAGANENRIADADVCTMCNSDKFFSYRASGGTCGRHGAIAFRRDSAIAASDNIWSAEEAIAMPDIKTIQEEKVHSHGDR